MFESIFGMEYVNVYRDSSQPGRAPILRRTRAAGFTLLEVAVILVVIALVMVGGAQLLSGMQVAVQQSGTASSLQQARAALLEFVALQRRLPCPDLTGTSGREGNANGVCPPGALSGQLPYITLGLPMPAINATSPGIRYAVLRDPVSADLVQPQNTAGALSVAINQSGTVSDGSLELMAALRQWASRSVSARLPFIGGANSGCAGPAFNPAIALSASGVAIGASRPLCFTQQDTWVSVPELLEFVNRRTQ